MNNNESLFRTFADAAKCLRKGGGNYCSARIPNDISPAQGRLLGFLYENPEADAAAIGQRFNLSKSSVSELISSLVETGYLTYEKSEKDGRHRKITMTEKGIAHTEHVFGVFAEYDEILAKGISDEEADELKRIIAKIKKNIEEAGL